MKTLILALFILESCFAQTNRFEAKFIEADSSFNLKYEKDMAALSKDLQANYNDLCELSLMNTRDGYKRFYITIQGFDTNYINVVLNGATYRNFKAEIIFYFHAFDSEKSRKELINEIKKLLNV